MHAQTCSLILSWTHSYDTHTHGPSLAPSHRYHTKWITKRENTCNRIKKPVLKEREKWLAEEDTLSKGWTFPDTFTSCLHAWVREKKERESQRKGDRHSTVSHEKEESNQELARHVCCGNMDSSNPAISRLDSLIYLTANLRMARLSQLFFFSFSGT